MTEGLEVHHVVPLSAGGAHGLPNLLSLCPDHHRELERELGRAARA